MPKTKEASMNDVLTAISGLTEVVSKLVEDKKPVEQPVNKVETIVNTAPVESKFPIPVEYRNIVDTVLNKKFEVDLDYSGDSASFNFSILVPKEYSNAGLPHWETYHEDRRTKVIVNALGVNGVRDWATQVYENFNPETKSRITFDRTQPL